MFYFDSNTDLFDRKTFDYKRYQGDPPESDTIRPHSHKIKTEQCVASGPGSHFTVIRQLNICSAGTMFKMYSLGYLWLE